MTSIIFTKGFTYKSRNFAFKDKILYRLPYVYKLRYFPLKEVLFKENHYRICRDKVGINKIKFLIEDIKIEVKITQRLSDEPF